MQIPARTGSLPHKHARKLPVVTTKTEKCGQIIIATRCCGNV